MGAKSRSKGRKFEQDVARFLRDWLGPTWTVARNQTDRQRGQLADCAGEFTIERATPSRLGGFNRFPFAIECKAGEAFDEGQLWREPVCGPIVKWWAQAWRQASAVGRRPMLICKRNLGEVLCAVRPRDVNVPPGPSMSILVSGAGVVVFPIASLTRCHVDLEQFAREHPAPPSRS